MSAFDPRVKGNGFGLNVDAGICRNLVGFFIRRTKDRDEAEDFAQEVLLRVVRSYKLEKIENLKSYIFKVAVNLLRDQGRCKSSSGAISVVRIDDIEFGEQINPLIEELSPERVHAGQDSLASVLRSLEELDARTKNIFLMSRLQIMKQRDLATFYGIGCSTVEKHVMKAASHISLQRN